MAEQKHTDECLAHQSKMGLAFCNCDCSDEHVHEWIPWEGNPWFFTCKDENCPRVLDILETTERVNATERLSAEDARVIADKHGGKTKAILLAYADTLGSGV